MEGKLNCLRCGVPMQLIKREYLQLGKTGWILGDWGNLLAGALEVDILCCPNCGKLEFFRGEWSGLVEEDGEDQIAQTECSSCGKRYDLDTPKCPFCGEKNPNW